MPVSYTHLDVYKRQDLQGERGKLYTLEVTVEKESEPLKPIDVKISDWVSGGNQDVETD